MISAYALERPSKWRLVGISGILILTILPILSALVAAFSTEGASHPLTLSFGWDILRSLNIAVMVAIISMLIGWPAGVLAGLYEFPGRGPLLGILALPLLIPSFLWAIGLSMLRIHLGLSQNSFLSGSTGSVIAFSILSLPLVTLTSLAATRGISQGQVDSAYLAGGDRLLLWCAARQVLAPSLLTSALVGILTLADPGPGQILGYRSAASEILVSFSALYDFYLATKQAIAMSAIALLPIIPLAVFVAPRITHELMARDTRGAKLQKRFWASIATPAMLGCILVLIALPLIGFAGPLLREFPLARAFEEVRRTMWNTILFALLAGSISTALGFLLAIAAGRSHALRQVTVLALLLMLSLPPTLASLGIIQAAASAPASLDIITRSRFTVGLLLAIRFLPIATFFGFRALGLSSPTWAAAAAIHGVSLFRYCRMVLFPWIFPMVFLSGLVIALLATAEINIILLLRPPGEDSLPITIFTVMANAPEALVSTLCLLYVVGAAILLASGWFLAKKLRPL